jgi:hypothetical protein
VSVLDVNEGVRLLYMFATLIAVEGADRVGKCTQSTSIVKMFNDMHRRARRIEIPFNDRLTYKVIYWMLRNGLAKKTPNLFQFVQFLNKFLFQVVVLPWLWRCERRFGLVQQDVMFDACEALSHDHLDG